MEGREELIEVAVVKRKRGKMKQPDKRSLREENRRLKEFAMAIAYLLKYEYADVSKSMGIFDISEKQESKE